MARECAMRRRHYNLRRLPSRKKKNICLPYLPSEIIFNILIFIPADVLYNVMRYVCRGWYNIIRSPNFIDVHLVRSSKGIILSQLWPNRFVHYLEMEKHDAKMTKLFPSSSTCQAIIVTTCNGLVLLTTMDKRNMFIANPITKEIVMLPHLGAPFMGCFHSGFAYASRSRKYKVVHFYLDNGIGGCKIVTVNIDTSWRRLGGLQEALIPRNFQASSFINQYPPISTEGFVHLISSDLLYTLSFDVETEKFYMCTIPKCLQKKDKVYSAIGGNFLSVMDSSSLFYRNFWVLTNVEVGEWIKVMSVDLESQQHWLQGTLCQRDFRLIHIGYLNDGEIVIFHFKRYTSSSTGQLAKKHIKSYISYNVNTGAVNLLHLDDDATYKGMYFPHVKSLVSPKCI